MANIGLMEGAFFVGRHELIDWVNSTLDLQVRKIEDTASGAVACQLLDIMHPGSIPMHKVNFGAKLSHEYVNNYKILQNAFSKLNIDKHIDVDRLISGRYMDNLEFMQWYKRFFELNVSDFSNYDPVGRRTKSKGVVSSTTNKPKSSTRNVVAPAVKKTKTPTPKPTQTNINSKNEKQLKTNTKTTTTKTVKSAKAAPAKNVGDENNVPHKLQLNQMKQEHEEKISLIQNQKDEVCKENEMLREEVEGLEKERDFYYEKLRDVEILLQEFEEQGTTNEVTKAIFKILYATADGFEAEENSDAVETDHNNMRVEDVEAEVEVKNEIETEVSDNKDIEIDCVVDTVETVETEMFPIPESINEMEKLAEPEVTNTVDEVIEPEVANTVDEATVEANMESHAVESNVESNEMQTFDETY